jgi:NodT family efflux transporter outer membrane factor (OMF) lipoprotein
MKRKIVACSLVVVLFGGCSTIEPELDVTIEMSESYDANSSATQKIQERWWESFNSSILNHLVAQALSSSPDLLASYQKIEQAKIALNSAGASYMPSLDAKAGTSTSKSYPDEGSTRVSKATSASVAMSYELDVWNRIGANIRASRANVEVSIYDYEALKLTLIANVVDGYLNYLATKERVEVAKANLEIAQKVLDVMEAKYRFGVINELDLRRQRTTLYNQQSSLLSLENELLGYKNALAILVGRTPTFFTLEEEALHSMQIVSVGAGLPSELLLRRPDIAAQKEAIESSKALIQAADAARYPSFSLSASGGTSSNELLSFSNPTHLLSAGLNSGYNIFDAGRLKNARLLEESKAQAVLQNYKKVVLNAFKEVEDALNEVSYTTQNRSLVEKIFEESQKSFKLATVQYQNGAIDFTTFLDAQKTFFSAKEQLLIAKKAQLSAHVTLYRALGGGFTLENAL